MEEASRIVSEIVFLTSLLTFLSSSFFFFFLGFYTLSPFISFQIFTRSIFRRVFSKDYDRIDLNAFLVRLARLLNRLFFLPSRNPSLIDRSLTISNLHLPPFPINSPLQIAPSQCFKLRRCKNTTKPSLRFLLINLSKKKERKKITEQKIKTERCILKIEKETYTYIEK